MNRHEPRDLVVGLGVTGAGLALALSGSGLVSLIGWFIALCGFTWATFMGHAPMFLATLVAYPVYLLVKVLFPTSRSDNGDPAGGPQPPHDDPGEE